MDRTFLPGTQIEILREPPRGAFRHALFDFDGTISLLRHGWQGIMGPVMVEMICGETEPTPDIEAEVARYIDESTGIQTIIQMEWLVKRVRAHGRVPPERILDAHGYKEIYNERLMVPVRERLRQLESGELTVEQATIRGAVPFIEGLAARGLDLYIFSGTDLADVRNEAEKLGVAPYFKEIWGALRTVEEYSKDKVLRELIESHGLRGAEVLIVGDGPVELRDAREYGCAALGVASDEAAGHGWDLHKRERLVKAGADLLVPDFSEKDALMDYLFPAGAPGQP